MHPETQALHLTGPVGEALPAVTPIYQTSAFEAGSAYFYTRKANPNSEELERVVCALEQCRYGVSTTTGMSAIALTMELLRPRDTVVINDLIYGCSYKAFQRLAARRELELHVLDLSRAENWSAIPQRTRMVFFETPTNPFLRSIRISALSDHLQSIGSDALIVVDNTWATPLYQKPLACGAHISLHSATKYFSGHADVMGGIVLTNDEAIHRELLEHRFYGGFILAPNDAWLLRRSLQTLSLRLRHQSEVTAAMRDFLSKRPEVEAVFYPDIDGEQLTSYGGILFLQLAEPYRDRYEDFKQSLALFRSGTGMACVTSMVAQPYTGSHASLSDEEKRAMGIDRGLVRLCFGLEARADLEADLTRAFERISAGVEVAP